MIVIDGEALNYETSILWECFPSNLEILIDDSVFTTNKTFDRRLTPEIERDRIYRDAVEKIWGQFDKDNSGQLDRAETRRSPPTTRGAAWPGPVGRQGGGRGPPDPVACRGGITVPPAAAALAADLARQ